MSNFIHSIWSLFHYFLQYFSKFHSLIGNCIDAHSPAQQPGWDAQNAHTSAAAAMAAQLPEQGSEAACY